MKRREVEVTLRGASVTPEQVPLRELVDVLQRIERLVTSFAVAKLEELREGPVVSLVGVRSGSERLAFSTPEPVIPAWAGISKAIKDKECVPCAASGNEQECSLDGLEVDTVPVKVFGQRPVGGSDGSGGVVVSAV